MRLYRWMLHFYPASFRAEYGQEMCAIFAQRRRDAGGFFGQMILWLETFFEVLFNALHVHADILRQDLRYAARTSSRAPGFTLTAIVVTALGVGAITAVFSVTDHVFLRPLPFADSERLVNLWQSPPGYTRMEPSPPNYLDWKKMCTSFEAMGAYRGLAGNLLGQGEPRRVEGATVTADLLPMLGVQPLMGRLFNAEDDRDGAPGTLILTHALWQGAFGSDAGILGRKLTLDGEPYVVIGVMPRSFYFPDRDTELLAPMRFRANDLEDRSNNELEVLAKLKPGVTLEDARAEMRVVAAQLERAYPKDNAHNSASVFRLREQVSDQSRMLLGALLGAAACLLLITCANLANLLLARALVRQKELSVRTALGAGRERLVRQMMTESLLLASLGGLLGIFLAAGAVPLLARLVPNSLPIAEVPALDIRFLIFAVLLTGLTGIGFGVVPALRVGRNADLSGLREGSRSGVGGRKERLRAVLVVAEVTSSVVLLVSAGLLLRALWRIQATEPGFRTEGVLTLRTPLPIPKYAAVALREQFYARVISETKALPGVTQAAYISGLPMIWGGGIWPVSLDGQPQSRESSNTASLRYVTPGFFATLGIPIRIGRDVSESDTQKSLFVAVVSESFVRRYWPNENPIGKRFQFAFKDRTVVGVAGDIRVRGLERNSEPQVYLPSPQVEDGWIIGYTPKELVVRIAGEPMAHVAALRSIVRNADAEQPISNIRTLAEIVDANTAPRAVQVRVLGAFAGVAILLAAIGIHGLLSYAVSQRKQEIGVRIALGAQLSDIFRMVLREGVVLAAIGVLLGVALAYASGRAMQSLLAGVTPADPGSFLTAAGVALVMAFAGSLLPALRAMRVDPATVIKSE